MVEGKRIKTLQDLILYFIDFLKSYNSNISTLNGQIEKLSIRVDKLERVVVPIINKIEKQEKQAGEVFHNILKVQERFEEINEKFANFKKDYQSLTKRQFYLENELDRVKYKTEVDDEY